MISSFGSYASGVSSSVLQTFFSRTDADTDASLSRDELIEALGKTAEATDSSAATAADDLISGLDGDSDGAVSQTEFQFFSDQFDYGGSGILLAAQEASQRGARFQSAFSSLDSDSSGGISADELTSALSSTLSDTDTSSLLDSLDGDDDGSVSENELESALDAAAESRRPSLPPGPPPLNGPPGSGMASSGDDSSAGGSVSGGSAAAGGTSSSTLNPLDTNQDGYVSAEERVAGTSTDTTSALPRSAGRLSSETMRFLLNGINEIAA
jgi:Ca2+-binding EF-hand superfamily protein